MRDRNVEVLIQKAYEEGKPFICVSDKGPLIKGLRLYQYRDGYIVICMYKGRVSRWLFTLEGNSLDVDELSKAILHIPDKDRLNVLSYADFDRGYG